jgi:hypothetical protein
VIHISSFVARLIAAYISAFKNRECWIGDGEKVGKIVGLRRFLGRNKKNKKRYEGVKNFKNTSTVPF